MCLFCGGFNAYSYRARLHQHMTGRLRVLTLTRQVRMHLKGSLRPGASTSAPGIKKRSVIQLCTIVHFKRLGSRHFHKEINLQVGMSMIDYVLCKTDLNPIGSLV